jgi:hypothetical protein
LCGIPEAVPLAGTDVAGKAIAVDVDFLEKPAVVQRVQQAEAEALGEPGAFDDVPQTQRLAGRGKCA